MEHVELLFPSIANDRLVQMPILSLAHIGDGIFELLARTFVAQSGIYKSGQMHLLTTRLVSARAQAKMAHEVFSKLNEDEQNYFLRGRNAKPKTIPKSASLDDYAYATALEAVFGMLYLTGSRSRALELFELCMEKGGK